MTKIYDFNFNAFADNTLPIQVIKTIVIELEGIKIAAIIGFNFPCTAKLRPTILYTTEIAKLNQMMFFIYRAIFNNFGNC